MTRFSRKQGNCRGLGGGGVELAVIASANAHGSSELRSCEKVEAAVMGGGGGGGVCVLGGGGQSNRGQPAT